MNNLYITWVLFTLRMINMRDLGYLLPIFGAKVSPRIVYSMSF